jgi:hypothetical protein
MKCPKCQSDNPSDSKCCSECGLPFDSSDRHPVLHTETQDAQITKFELSLQDFARSVTSLREDSFNWLEPVHHRWKQANNERGGSIL